jgi:hypothetical protein
MELSACSFERLWRSSFGRYQVTPSAGPRGMMLTLWTGSWWLMSTEMSVCPASWTAVVRFSSSEMTIERRSVPM